MTNEAEYIEATGLEQPASQSVTISPHATDEIVHPTDLRATRGLYVGSAGSVVCRLLGDTSDQTFSGVLAGSVLPIRVTHIRSTSGASSMVGLY